MKPCECGCGQLINNRFVSGHNTKGSKQSKETILKRKNTFLQRFGHVCSLHSAEGIKKKKETLLRNYNVESPSQSKEIREKSKSTCLNHYGVENPSQSLKIQEKIKQSNLLKYGVESTNQLISVKNKRKITLLKHYGVDHFSKTPQARLLHRKTFIKTIENQKNNGQPLAPRIGYEEQLVLDNLQKYTHYQIIRQEQQFRYIIGQFPDGHIPELKLFIQFDEREHFTDNTYKKYKEIDLQKTLDLASLGYIIFRISEKDWLENKNSILEQFQILLTNIDPLN